MLVSSPEGTFEKHLPDRVFVQAAGVPPILTTPGRRRRLQFRRKQDDTRQLEKNEHLLTSAT